ncbi:MAG: hypothetical protein PHT40_04430, partial [Patescibacteria group bacterium]|nr:hypothetical protein [Patescibacteria group bacterium]
NVFVEIPYGLQKDKLMFKYVGGKIIHFHCQNETNKKRVKKRGTPQHLPFIKKIPDKKEVIRLVKKYGLKVMFINTDCSYKKMEKKAEKLNRSLKTGGIRWTTFL